MEREGGRDIYEIARTKTVREFEGLEELVRQGVGMELCSIAPAEAEEAVFQH